MESILEELKNKSKINSNNYLLVAGYFSFFNSLLEELFFRGFIFLGLYNLGYKKLAHIFSAGLFAVYHVAIFATWFNPSLMTICIIGLFIGGVIFNYIDIKSNTIFNSWIVHILADLTIAYIGFIYLF